MTTTEHQNDTIILKHAHQMPGITFRKFRGEADYQAMAAITNASNQADGEEKLITAEDILNIYTHLDRCDPAKDMIYAEFEGQAVGFGRCGWWKEYNGNYIYSSFINLHPDFRRDDIPLVMMRYLQDRLLEIAATHPVEVPKYLQVTGSDDAGWHKELMKKLGIDPVRYWIAMTRPCSQPVNITPLPEGIEIRSVSARDYRKVFDTQSEAFRDYWSYIPPTEKDYQRWLEQPTFDPSIWKVAWQGDQIVGQVLNFVDHKENEEFTRKRGYTEAISVRKPWRRQGVARGLLTRSIHMFQEMGMEETALGVDTGNSTGATKLYENVGYKETKRRLTYRAQIAD
jgi:ribosomal protein S18 acetylase RimI-like enzyme